MMNVKKYSGKSRGKIVLTICKECKCQYEVLENRIKIGKGIFCSKECYNKHRSISEQERLGKHKIYQKKYKYNLNSEEYNTLIKKK